MHASRLYFRYVSYSLRAQLSYRASFVLQAFSNLIICAAEFFGIWVLYSRFGGLTGWTLPQVAILYGLADTAFALAEAIPRGFDEIPQMVKSGDFDRILLRPRSPAFQILAIDLRLMRIGRLSQGLSVLAWGLYAAGIPLTPAHLAMVAFAILGGTCLFAGTFICGAALAFWTTESLEIVNIATYGGSYAATYPLTIYRPWFRAALTFVLPLATINYLPAHVFLGRVETVFGAPLWVQCASPLVGVAFLILSLQFWRVGVRHYKSTGS